MENIDKTLKEIHSKPLHQHNISGSANVEEFRDVFGYENYYQISTTGKVFSKRASKYLKHTINPKNNVHSVSMFGDNGKKTTSVAKLIATTFIHNPNPKLYNIAIVINGNQNDLRLENICWGTQSISTRNRLKRNPKLLENFIKNGTKINTRKMNDYLERQLLKMYELGYSISHLENIFPIKKSQIRNIINRNIPKHFR